MIETLRRFLLRRRIHRWNVMHARYLMALRAQAEFSRESWPDYKPDQNYRDGIDK